MFTMRQGPEQARFRHRGLDGVREAAIEDDLLPSGESDAPLSVNSSGDELADV